MRNATESATEEIEEIFVLGMKWSPPRWG
jgi:hypothetical protein